ncbi:MAG: DUF4136 domain-containing protein [Bryobacteraceae bacterium]|jgi:hypothetical protein
MMKRNIFILAGFIGAAVLLFAADAKIDYNHSTDFGQYHTYSWMKVDAGDSLWVDRIKGDVDAQLTAKGWNKVDSGGDAAISAFGSTRNQQTLQTFYDGFGGGWRWRGFGPDLATTAVENTPVGTLVIDIFDGHTKSLIWRGISTKTLTDKPDKNEKKLEDQVQSMFKHFPPAPKT